MTTTEMPPDASGEESHDDALLDAEPEEEKGRIARFLQKYRRGLSVTAR